MIKKFIGFIIVGVIGLAIGYLLALFKEKHPIFTAKNAQSIMGIVQDPTKAVELLTTDESKAPPATGQAGPSPTPEGTTSSSSPDKSTAAAPAAPSSNTSSSDKKEGDKKGDDKKEAPSQDQKLLGSLWVVKKDKASDVSNGGVLYVEGTSPYGLPETFKEDLFAPENMLSLPDDPHNRSPEGLIHLTQPTVASSTQFWVQLGAFPSLIKAQKTASYFLSKGYTVELYQKRFSDQSPAVYFIRLKEVGAHSEMLKKARIIRKLENIVPILVEYNTSDRKL